MKNEKEPKSQKGRGCLVAFGKFLRSPGGKIPAWVLLAGLATGCGLVQNSDLEDLTSNTEQDLSGVFTEPVDALVNGLLNDSAHVISRRDVSSRFERIDS